VLTTALVLFVLAALLGATLLSFVLRKRHTPKGIALVHGFLAAAGIVLLVVFWITASDAPRLSLGLFVVAAAGGGVLITLDLRRGQAPAALAVGHGLIALAALALLIGFWLGQ